MAPSAKHAFLYFLVLLGMISSPSASRVLKPQELDHQSNGVGKAEHLAKLAFSGGIGIGIGIGSGNGTGHGGSIGYGQGSGGSGRGKGSKSGRGGIGIGIGGGFEWGSGGEARSNGTGDCTESKQGCSSSGHHEALVGDLPPLICYECPSCCPPESARQLQHEGQKMAVPVPHQVDHALAPSNCTRGI